MYKISHLSLDSFMSIKRAEIDFDIGDNMILITGFDHKKRCSNGSGKTTIMDGILFSKFGVVLKGGAQKYALTTPELVHYYDYNNTMRTRLELVETSDNNRIAIEKSIKNAIKPQNVIKTKIFENDDLLQGGFKSSREYDRYFREHILQFDVDSFYRLHVFYGSSYIHFFSLPTPKKLDIIEHFITLTSFNDISKEISKDMGDLDGDISELMSILGRKKEEKTVVRKHSEKYKEMAITSLNKDLKDKRERTLKLKASMDLSVKERKELEDELSAADYEGQIKALMSQKSTLDSQLARVKSKI